MRPRLGPDIRRTGAAAGLVPGRLAAELQAGGHGGAGRPGRRGRRRQTLAIELGRRSAARLRAAPGHVGRRRGLVRHGRRRARRRSPAGVAAQRPAPVRGRRGRGAAARRRGRFAGLAAAARILRPAGAAAQRGIGRAGGLGGAGAVGARLRADPGFAPGAAGSDRRSRRGPVPSVRHPGDQSLPQAAGPGALRPEPDRTMDSGGPDAAGGAPLVALAGSQCVR